MQTKVRHSAAELDKAQVMADYRLAVVSRQASLLGRKEVLTGKAKFGIFGDGKELAQLAMARAFAPGDLRSGYYRDQTFMFAIGALDLAGYFAQLYADPDPAREPASAGRQMNAHFSTAFLTADGAWRELKHLRGSSADLSPTGSQMPRLVGLAHASRFYRELPALAATPFSAGGREVAFGTIGNASCAEGMFWESLNAIGVLRAQALISIWDDGYGISVPNSLQVTKGDLSELVSGFAWDAVAGSGFEIRRVAGWSYPQLVAVYAELARIVRDESRPALVHVVEMTQPQGHSTSGSHERYKSRERLEWEQEFDGIKRMRAWMIEDGLATGAELDAIEAAAKDEVAAAQTEAWRAFREPTDRGRAELDAVLGDLEAVPEVAAVRARLAAARQPLERDLAASAHEALVALGAARPAARARLLAWAQAHEATGRARYAEHLFAPEERAATAVAAVPPIYAPDAVEKNGYEIINACFDAALARTPHLVAMGEDLGKIGDVNQGFAGLQEKYGALRVADTGIRECTILGQAIGMAMRGLRPIAEIQYLDYVLYALQIMSDDLATVRWRSAGQQMAPVIVRTRGHRLEGIWHSGSPMAGILGLVRGVHVLVPRNFVQASGFYNTLLAADDPAIVVEVLNGYRQKERMPSNIGELRLALGVPEILRPGKDLTLVTYGACCRIVLEAAERLERVGIDAEVIDVQSLLPFDSHGLIAASIARTHRVVFIDEDVPGGATAFMMREVLEVQGAYHDLDSEPRTHTAAAHRPAYGSDGDYWSKPSRESIFRAAYELMRESDPLRYPDLFA